MTAAHAGQTFRRMYSQPDCLINEHDFQWAYLEADGQVNPLLSKKTGPLVQIQVVQIQVVQIQVVQIQAA